MFQRINRAKTSTLLLSAITTGVMLGALILFVATVYLRANY